MDGRKLGLRGKIVLGAGVVAGLVGVLVGCSDVEWTRPNKGNPRAAAALFGMMGSGIGAYSDNLATEGKIDRAMKGYQAQDTLNTLAQQEAARAAAREGGSDINININPEQNYQQKEKRELLFWSFRCLDENGNCVDPYVNVFHPGETFSIAISQELFDMYKGKIIVNWCECLTVPFKFDPPLEKESDGRGVTCTLAVDPNLKYVPQTADWVNIIAAADGKDARGDYINLQEIGRTYYRVVNH